jgi:hypothetical protein
LPGDLAALAAFVHFAAAAVWQDETDQKKRELVFQSKIQQEKTRAGLWLYSTLH